MKKEEILPGKRENVFEFDDDIIIKSNEKIHIDESVLANTWSQQYQNEKITYFILKVN